MRRPRTVAIAGAGIGGLTAALALAEAGLAVIVLERSATLSEAGAGIQLSPNAGRVLAALGLDEALAATAAEPAALEIRTGRNHLRLASLPLGRLGSRLGMPYRTIHRADLQRILLDAGAGHAGIDLRLGRELVEFAAHSRGVTILAETHDGSEEIVADALIAADGIRSIVRRAMPGGSPLRPAGQMAWRAVIPAAVLREAGLAADRVGLWIGPGAHLVHYPLRGGAEVNLVAITAEKRPVEGWDSPGKAARLLPRFRRWARPVRTVLETVADWRCWAIASVDPTGPWALGRIALLGDAAHAMPPYLAQGGAMAIEDAAVLAAELAVPGEIEDALQRYQARRRLRVRRVWRASRSAGELYHMGALTGAVRNLGMIALGGRGMLAQYNWLYRWRP